MAKKREEAWERQAEKIWKTLDRVSKEQEEFAKEIRRLTKAQERLEKSQKKTDLQIKQTHQGIQRLREAIRESQEKTDLQIKQTQQEIQQLRKTIKESQEKTDLQIKQTQREIQQLRETLKEAQVETNKQMRETDKRIDKISKDIGGGLGRMAEGLTAPCVPVLFKQYGMNIIGVHQRVKAFDNGKVIAEVDIIGVGMLNGKNLFLVGEVKGHLTSEDVKYLTEEVLPYFREYYSKNFKELKDKETYVYGFVSGIFIDESAKKFANRKGLYILEPKGETMHIINPPAFKPKLW